jgi:hypothetical protein
VYFNGGRSASDALVLGAGGAFASFLRTTNLSIVQRGRVSDEVNVHREIETPLKQFS